MPTSRELARLIDHTILRPEATETDVAEVCAAALKYEFASVCVNGCWVPLASAKLEGSRVKVCTVVGFPLGASSSSVKVAEAMLALDEGAHELDMVINVGRLKAGDDTYVESEIGSIVEVAHRRGAIVKVIIETALLTDEEKVRACQRSVAAGADFVKTSTGFAKSGATAVDIALMRRTVGPEIGVKASGGVRTLADLLTMVEAGASRIGASSSVAIVESMASA